MFRDCFALKSHFETQTCDWRMKKLDAVKTSEEHEPLTPSHHNSPSVRLSASCWLTHPSVIPLMFPPSLMFAGCVSEDVITRLSVCVCVRASFTSVTSTHWVFIAACFLCTLLFLSELWEFSVQVVFLQMCIKWVNTESWSWLLNFKWL